MSYALASALQTAVFTALSQDLALQTLVGGNVFDATPTGTLPLTYVLVGEETARGRSDISAAGAVHDFTVTVVSDAAGFQPAKDAAVAVSDVLEDANLPLTRGRIVYLRFIKARARRGQVPQARRIDLTFRARLEDI